MVVSTFSEEMYSEENINSRPAIQKTMTTTKRPKQTVSKEPLKAAIATRDKDNKKSVISEGTLKSAFSNAQTSVPNAQASVPNTQANDSNAAKPLTKTNDKASQVKSMGVAISACAAPAISRTHIEKTVNLPEGVIKKPAVLTKDVQEKETTNKTAKSKTEKTSSKKKHRAVKNQEIPDKKQTKLTQHFQVRRSERRLKDYGKNEKRKELEERILSNDDSHLEVRILEEKGRGVFPKKKLLKGDLVCEYAGDLIDMKEARRREEEYAKNVQFGCYMYYFEYKNQKYCVDATKESGRLGRLLNHSKTNGNVCTKLFPINDVPRLILFANRDILDNEELLYDYGDRSKTSIESHPWLKT